MQFSTIKDVSIRFLIALTVVLCLSYLCATADAREEERAAEHKKETITAAKRELRLQRIASEMKAQLAEVKQ